MVKTTCPVGLFCSSGCTGTGESRAPGWHGCKRLRGVLELSILLLVLGGCRVDQPATPATLEPTARTPAFVGSWSLVSWTGNDGTERCAEPGGAAGQIMYSADGHMSAQLGCTGVVVDEEGLDAEEARARVTRRHFSYYGRYTVDETTGVVTHHVQGSVNPGWVGSDQQRAFNFEGDERLMLSPVGSTARLTWQRNN